MHQIVCLDDRISSRSTPFSRSISCNNSNYKNIVSQFTSRLYGVSISTRQSFDIAKFIEIFSLSLTIITYTDQCTIENTGWFKWWIKNIKSRIKSRTNTYVMSDRLILLSFSLLFLNKMSKIKSFQR